MKIIELIILLCRQNVHTAKQSPSKQREFILKEKQFYRTSVKNMELLLTTFCIMSDEILSRLLSLFLQVNQRQK